MSGVRHPTPSVTPASPGPAPPPLEDATRRMDVNLADLIGAIASRVPDRCALACDGERRSYADLMRRAAQVAQHLIAAGLQPDETVGLYLLNSAAYVESLLGCMLARTTPVNINYRYTGNELAHLLGRARLATLVVDADHAALAAAVAPACQSLRHVLVAGGDETAAGLALQFPGSVTALGYDAAVAGAPEVAPDNDRSGDDKLIMFTGGTTGLPKGVLWRHEDFFFSALAGGNHYGPPRTCVAEVAEAAAQVPAAGYVITAPMMHAGGTYTLFSAFMLGATVVLSRKFDAARALRQVGSERAMVLSVVGDAMARPIADELAAHPGEYDLSSLMVFGSGGALLSPAVRQQLLAAKPGLYITDRFGASETGTDGELGRGPGGGATLTHAGNMHVLDERLRPVAAGETGRLAKSGHVPLGYFGDAESSAATFPILHGVRFALLGDLARLEPDGSIVVLGRGSTCINSGGEKVFPEEVEQALKAHPDVLDAIVAGVPDERFGERAAAVVQLRTGADADAAALRAHCRLTLAGYKVPARIQFVPAVARSPSGKADLRWARAVLTGERLASS
jgi:acyl-CoA synthetase (AMP-forming)/AMP-acid ligase II